MSDVGTLFSDQPITSLDDRIAQAQWIVDMAIHRHVTMADKKLAGIVVLFSGGGDSTVLAHLMRERATHFAHANTGIGIEQTRQFVRDVSELWGKPLIEKHGESYRERVIRHGFPGPGQHYAMYRYLKERALRQVRKELVANGRRERVLFLGGIRRAESQRRADRQEFPVEGSVVWVSPIVHWSNDDMRAYRERFPEIPRNEVSDHLHMSGECLCGAFAKPGELDEIGMFYPEVRAEIEALQVEVRAAGHPEARCRWGWGADKDALLIALRANPDLTPSEVADKFMAASSPLCSTCEWRQESLFGEVAS